MNRVFWAIPTRPRGALGFCAPTMRPESHLDGAKSITRPTKDAYGGSNPLQKAAALWGLPCWRNKAHFGSTPHPEGLRRGKTSRLNKLNENVRALTFSVRISLLRRSRPLVRTSEGACAGHFGSSGSSSEGPHASRFPVFPELMMTAFDDGMIWFFCALNGLAAAPGPHGCVPQ